VQYSDAAIRQILNDYIYGSQHPDLVVYRRDFGTKFTFENWLTWMRSRCKLGGFFNKRILEVGCGFGWDAVGLSLVGENEVVAIDTLPSMIDGVRECLETVSATGHRPNVTPLHGDICNLSLPDCSFDGIYSSEAVEHVHDLAAMFKRCWSLLRPGGRLLIANDSNRFNSSFREATFSMWKQRDESWEHARWLEAEVRPIEHKGAKPYAAMREEIIDEAAPDMDAATRAKVVEATAGMIRPQIEEVARNAIKGGELPKRPAFSWCRNPETGEYAERLLDPFEMADMIRTAGFVRVRIRHGFNRFPFRVLNGIQFRRLNEFLFDRKAIFIVLADKTL